MAKRSAFTNLLVDAIDETLNSLSKSVKQSIYFIENEFKVAGKDIPENLEEFQEGLEKKSLAQALAS